MKRVLVLWANNTIPNLGVRALAAGSTALVRRAWPDADVRVHGAGPGGPENENDGPMNIGHIPPLAKERLVDHRGLRQWLTSFDLVINTRAGDSFADIYGRRRLLKMSVITEYARQWKVPVVLGPQTIGPFRHADTRLLARHILRGATQVMVRDPVSAEQAKTLGRRPDVVATDVVFALERPLYRPPQSRDVILNVSGLLWMANPHVSAQAYREEMVRLIGSLEASGRTVSLLAHVASDPMHTVDNDVIALREIERVGGTSHELLVPSSLGEARTMLSSCSLLIGARMHACLNALSVGTPAIALAYSRKFAPLLSSLGWPHSIDLRTAADVVGATIEIARRDDLVAKTSEVLERADLALTTAASTLRDAIPAVDPPS